MTQRSAFVLKVRPEKIDEYIDAHRTVWPEMLEALRAAGIRNYSIFRAATKSSATSSPMTSTRPDVTSPHRTSTRAAQDHMAPLLEERVSDDGPPPLQEIFRLD